MTFRGAYPVPYMETKPTATLIQTPATAALREDAGKNTQTNRKLSNGSTKGQTDHMSLLMGNLDRNRATSQSNEKSLHGHKADGNVVKYIDRNHNERRTLKRELKIGANHNCYNNDPIQDDDLNPFQTPLKPLERSIKPKASDGAGATQVDLTREGDDELVAAPMPRPETSRGRDAASKSISININRSLPAYKLIRFRIEEGLKEEDYTDDAMMRFDKGLLKLNSGDKNLFNNPLSKLQVEVLYININSSMIIHQYLPLQYSNMPRK